MDLSGLSPLTRGNLRQPSSDPDNLGPIPAHAGEPPRPNPLSASVGAYPRSRGGTGSEIWASYNPEGLSPLTRGNHKKNGIIPVVSGPIPAHAGEPGRGRNLCHGCGAYPRSRGGTAIHFRASTRSLGLSPLTRGNRKQKARGFRAFGPIPAHAGEPKVAIDNHGRDRAYPRSRGGTYSRARMWPPFWGLSPLTRGNRACRAAGCSWCGPIPAHAGEPHCCSPPDRATGAYPRSRGGTGAPLRHCWLRWGLSPLTRGNRCRGLTQRSAPGPIPAHAGEPRRGLPHPPHQGAYPRSRGGTAIECW